MIELAYRCPKCGSDNLRIVCLQVCSLGGDGRVESLKTPNAMACGAYRIGRQRPRNLLRRLRP